MNSHHQFLTYLGINPAVEHIFSEVVLKIAQWGTQYQQLHWEKEKLQFTDVT